MAKYLDLEGVELLWGATNQRIQSIVDSTESSLSNAIDRVDQKATSNSTEITNLKKSFSTLLENPDDAINSFNEIVEFLNGISGTTLQDLMDALGTSVDELEKKVKKGDEDAIALVVKLHAAITFTVNKSVIEKGVNTEVSITHSATFDGKGLTYTLAIPGVTSNAGASPFKHTINSKTTFNGQFIINNADPKIATTINRSVEVKAVNASYYGQSTAATIDANGVKALTKVLATGVSGLNNTAVTKANNYMWFCVPSVDPNLTINKVDANSLTFPLNAAITVAVNGVNYKCYRAVDIFNVNGTSFKFTVS